jgi:hypothetical protein
VDANLAAKLIELSGYFLSLLVIRRKRLDANLSIIRQIYRCKTIGNVGAHIWFRKFPREPSRSAQCVERAYSMPCSGNLVVFGSFAGVLFGRAIFYFFAAHLGPILSSRSEAQ